MPRFSTSLLLLAFFLVTSCSPFEDNLEPIPVETEAEYQNQSKLEPLPSIEDAWRAGERTEGPVEPPRPTELAGRVEVRLLEGADQVSALSHQARAATSRRK